MKAEQFVYTTYNSPFGTVVVAGSRGLIRSVRVMTRDGRFAPDPSWRRADSEWREACAQLEAYFAGGLRDFTLPLDPGGTPFQKQVWEALCEVPYGETTTYAALARTVGRPNAARAVGGAMNRNPITIIVPCHRVVGQRGCLTGYLNGVDMKRRLLEMESGELAFSARSLGGVHECPTQSPGVYG